MYAAKVIYHYEPEGWWAESSNFPGFTAVGESFNETRELVREGLLDFCDEEINIVEIIPPLNSADPLTSSSGFDSTPPLWRCSFSKSRQNEAWGQENATHTTSSDDISQEKNQPRNRVFA